MPRLPQDRWSRLLIAAAALALVGALIAVVLTRTTASAAITLPPAGAGFDYQLGGPYTPPDGVEIVSRDRTAEPADGLYNICYVNAFQVQPGEQSQWDSTCCSATPPATW